MTQIPDLGTITVREIRDGLSTGKFTAETLTEAALAHVKAMNPTFNAIIFNNDEAALETARDIDLRIASRHGARRLLQFGRSLRADFPRPEVERTGADPTGLRLRAEHLAS